MLEEPVMIACRPKPRLPCPALLPVPAPARLPSFVSIGLAADLHSNNNP
jgi:hypothetical protein